MYADTHTHQPRAPTPSTAVQITTLSQHCLSAFVFAASPPLFPSHVRIPVELQGPGLKRCRDEGQRDSERKQKERGRLNYSMGMQICVSGCFFCFFFWGGGFIFKAGIAPPVASGSVAATVKGRKVNILSLPFYLKRNLKKEKKKKKYYKYKTHNSRRLVQS